MSILSNILSLVDMFLIFSKFNQKSSNIGPRDKTKWLDQVVRPVGTRWKDQVVRIGGKNRL